MKARLGGAGPARGPARPHVWLHGASNGELTSARPVLTRLVAARPDLGWLVTANTRTALELVEGWDLAGVTARPAPLDLGWVTSVHLRRWNVVAHVALEAELWPHRVLRLAGPVLLLGARMTAGTARAWLRLHPLGPRVLGRVTWASAQDAASRDRLLALGLPETALGPVVDLKALYDPPRRRADPALDAAFPRDTTWLAASTHPGDEEIVLAAHLEARRIEPQLRLILAPRHPRRGTEIAALADRQGLTIARRSQGEDPRGTDIYLADTMGEMALWYPRAGRVFIGGTLSDRGGHTPYEPAAFGAALIHGPDVANFAAAFARLAAASAARRVADAPGLARALTALSDAACRTGQAAKAKAALSQPVDLDALVAQILARLPQPVT